MACLDENTLMRYLEGVLSSEDAQRVEEHVAACEECRWLLSVAVADAGPETGEAEGASLLPTRHRTPTEPGSAGPTPETPRVGEVLKGTYLVERFIGKGGMGQVYQASHRRLNRRYAIKFLGGAAAGHRQAVARMRQEAEVTSRLNHPNIVEVIDFDYTEDGTPYIVMELLEGESLARRMRRAGAFRDMAELASIMRQTTSALEAAHRGGVVHRDLTPTNIFLCKGKPYPLVKVMDFGISKVLGTPTGLTADMAVLGSPRYMAPEQALGRSAEVDGRADVFALGVILYEMLCGVPPFGGDSVPETLFKVVYQEPATPPAWKALPEPFQYVVLRSLSKDPAQRPPSMAQLWRELADAMTACNLSAELEQVDLPSEQRVAARGVGRWGRRRLLWAAGGVLAAALAVLAVWAVLGLRESSGPRPPVRPAVASPALSAADAAVGPPDARAPHPRGRRPRPRRRLGCLIVQSKDRSGEYLWANARVDGKYVGQTALTLERLPVGWHTVEVKRPGYRPMKRRVRVRPGKCTHVRFQLRR